MIKYACIQYFKFKYSTDCLHKEFHFCMLSAKQHIIRFTVLVLPLITVFSVLYNYKNWLS